MKKLLIISAMLTALALSGCQNVGEYNVQVMLTEGEGYSILGENPMPVKAGDDAVFKIELEDGWSFAYADGEAIWNEENSTLTVEDVYYPMTVNMLASDADKMVRFFLEKAGDGKGNVGISSKEVTFYPGTPIEVWVSPSDGSNFVGWSVNKPLSNGGELYSTDTKIQFSVPEKDRNFLYANFEKIKIEEAPSISNNNLDGPTVIYEDYGIQGNESTHMIAYDVNGGSIVGYDTKVFYDEVSTAVFAFPNTLPEMGYFKRDGYLLLEYNTEPDGSGRSIPCGGKVILPEGDMTTLYCIWTPVTDVSSFTTSNYDDGVAISGYSGEHEKLVIPAYIDGQPVRAIKKGAIKSGSYKTLILPNTLRTVESGAFTDSKNMEEMWFYDTLVTMKNNAFSDLSGWRRMRIVAAQMPRFSKNDDPSYTRKWERLWQVSQTDAKKLVVCSGSSSFYGLRTPLLEELLDGEYAVINFGNLAQAQVAFFMDVLADFLDEDDIIVHAPETGYDGVMGYDYFFWWIYRVLEYNYEMLYYVDDISLYTHVLDAYSEAAGYKSRMAALDYDVFKPTIDEYGDHSGDKPNINPSDKYFGKEIDFYYVNAEWIDNLNFMYDRVMNETGCKIVMSFAPFNYNALTKNSRTEDGREYLMDRLTELVEIPIISHIWDYMLPGDLMYNSDYHPTDEGCEKRTRKLAEDLKAYFAEEAGK